MIYVIILVLAIVFLLFSFYNKLKTTQVRIKASIQEIGNQLKRQANLIPNLVDSVKGYMTHEKGIFDQLTEARKSIDQAVQTNDPKAMDKSQELINKALGSIKVVMESNPEIKASDLVSNLMNELRDTADKLMYARRTLIDLTADFNTTISTIPGMWIAPLFGFKEEKGLSTPTDMNQLEVSKEETKNPEVKL
ncbi:MAG: LemA family protein [Candidatus Shapirobacteria bacterium]|nr:LemA family protein [Candidatus Shapirobacteria bacterium]MDD3003004.1 LemA family protein [Candidatus Shapirobacteria bacterium]MDD4382561.1 LemA family protein [Candidatus Shapirobacteria bacterium]